MAAFLATLGPRTLSNGRVFSAEDAAELRRLDQWLRERFARHVALMRNRKRTEG